jgi:hypothetical protein
MGTRVVPYTQRLYNVTGDHPTPPLRGACSSESESRTRRYKYTQKNEVENLSFLYMFIYNYSKATSILLIKHNQSIYYSSFFKGSGMYTHCQLCVGQPIIIS